MAADRTPDLTLGVPEIDAGHVGTHDRALARFLASRGPAARVPG